MQKTCVLIKPDAVRNKNIGEIISIFESENFEISACKMIHLSDALLEAHYKNVADQDFFEDLKTFMKSAPVLALVLKKENAIREARNICGKNHTEKNTIRGKFATDFRENAIHSSDSIENAESEISRFFPSEEIF